MVYLVYLHCEIHHKSPYNVRFGPGKVLKKSLVLIHQNLWEPCALEWMPGDLIDGKSTLVQVVAWCRQAASHYLNQCWQRHLMPYGVTRPHWVNCTVMTWLFVPVERLWRECQRSCLCHAGGAVCGRRGGREHLRDPQFWLARTLPTVGGPAWLQLHFHGNHGRVSRTFQSYAEFISGNMKNYLHFLSCHWDGSGCWNLSSEKTRTHQCLKQAAAHSFNSTWLSGEQPQIVCGRLKISMVI